MMNAGPEVNPRKKLACAAVLLTLSVCGASQDEFGRVHDKGYWQTIINHDYTPPADAPLSSLVRELSSHLASTDPELRDSIAYTVLTQWLYVKQLVPHELRCELIAEWSTNLRRGIGEQGTPTVFRRSFSALMLSVAAALDNKVHFLERTDFERLLHAALGYMRDEKDTRGFDAEKGWVHSVAHTADLLKFLARSRHLEVDEQSAVLKSVSDKLADLDHALVHGEDERLARVAVSIIARPDFDLLMFETFVAELQPTPSTGPPTIKGLAVSQNRRHVAVSLYAILATDQRELDSLKQARGAVRTLLATTM
jgi:hypothetical protein